MEIDKYCAMGSPHSPNREETELLKREGWSTAKEMIIVFFTVKI